MKYHIVSAIIGGVLAVGCADSDSAGNLPKNGSAPIVPRQNEAEPIADPDGGEVTLEDVGREIGEALDTTKDLAEQKRDDYAEEMDEKLKDLDEHIGELKEQSRDLSLETMQDWEKQKTALYEKRETARAKLAELKSSSGAAWGTMKTGVEAAWLDLKQAYEKAADEFGSSKPE